MEAVRAFISVSRSAGASRPGAGRVGQRCGDALDLRTGPPDARAVDPGPAQCVRRGPRSGAGRRRPAPHADGAAGARRRAQAGAAGRRGRIGRRRGVLRVRAATANPKVSPDPERSSEEWIRTPKRSSGPDSDKQRSSHRCVRAAQLQDMTNEDNCETVTDGKHRSTVRFRQAAQVETLTSRTPVRVLRLWMRFETVSIPPAGSDSADRRRGCRRRRPASSLPSAARVRHGQGLRAGGLPAPRRGRTRGMEGA